MKRPHLAVLLFGLVGLPAPALADCVTRTFKDAGGVDRALIVPAPSAEAKDYEALGFQAASCGTIDKAASRDQLCGLTKLGNDAVQKRLEEVLGAPPAKMCASAKLEASVATPIAADTSTTTTDGSTTTAP